MLDMRHIYLVRHAEYDSPLPIAPGRLPFPLSATGREQAKRLQTFFQDKAINAIYSSAVLRCRETATIIANEQAPIHYDQRLLETLSAYQGFWYEQSMDWTHFFGHRDELGGEGAQDILNRVGDFWTQVILSSDSEENLVICSHGDPLYCLGQFLRGTRQMDDQQLYQLNDADYQPKGSIQEIMLDGKQVVEIKAIIMPS
jgi:broad specificity phosphatase PhoE